jgi:hypothetical protein
LRDVSVSKTDGEPLKTENLPFSGRGVLQHAKTIF